MIKKITFIKWGKLVSYSLADQGIVSIVNFLFNIYLANKLGSEGYGAFAFGYSIFLFFSGFHNALILEPLSVFGTAKHKENFIQYLIHLLGLHFVVCGILSFIGLLSTVILWNSFNQIAKGLLGASLSTTFILLYWLLRRACYSISSPKTALKGSLAYAIVLSSVLLIDRLYALNILSSFVWMAFASILASSILLSMLVKRNKDINKDHITLLEIWSENWRYGRWVVGSAIVYWMGYTITVPAIGVLLGLSGSGTFRAMQNLIMPLQQIGTALGALFLPWFSERTPQLDPETFRTKAKLVIFGFTLMGIAYFLFLFLAKGSLIPLLYHEPGYIQFSWLIILLGIFGVFDIAAQGISIILRALQKPDSIFRSQVGGAIVSVTLNLFLIWKFGLLGAGIGMIITGGIVFLFQIIEFDKTKRDLRQNL